MRGWTCLLLIGVSLSGCSTYAVQRYNVSVDNVMTLKKLNENKLNVGPFTATKPNQREIMCRGVGPIKTPDGENFENYIRKALIDELKLADAFATDSAVTLAGHLSHIDFNSNSGKWMIDLTVSSSNGNSLNVSEVYDYKTSFYGETACNQTAQALLPAVQDLISKVIHNPKFADLVK